MKTDYLVVGSGLSALAFAALMARAGKRVVVLEAHYAAGGYGHTFSYTHGPDVYRFNAQLHYVWNCGAEDTVGRFLRKLGLEDEVTFERLDPNGFDRMRMPGHAIDIPNDWDLLASRLAEAFPRDVDRCRAFLCEVRALKREIDALPPAPRVLRMIPRLHRFRRLLRYRNATLQDVFDAFELPLEAQTLIALQWPDFLLPPGKLSFFAWVMLFTGYMGGAYYPTRHFEHVVEALVATIGGAGGEVRLNHRVTDFVVEGGRVSGVVAEEVDDDGIATGPVHELRGAEVVANMDPRRVGEMLGMERFSRKVRSQLTYEYSPSNFMAYCVVDGIDLRDHGFGRSNLFHSDEPDLNVAFQAMLERGDYSRPSFAVTVPTLLTDDRTDCPPGKQIVEFLTVADYERFKHLRFSKPRQYSVAKREIFDAILDVVEREYVPKLRNHIVFKMLGSPTTNERFVNSPRGNSYGSNMTPANMGAARLGWQSSVPGLYFCSATSGYAGFAGTIWTGSNLYGELTGDAFV
ncbi:MAG: NAD(P)/FAD-dependent oxidoreductase [Myxococcota bacterium]|jgi:phytoene dehydrogenase-like protein|nr:NAD(P)/FAD-dependent oxidoreductase [Myxococcota bacterium]